MLPLWFYRTLHLIPQHKKDMYVLMSNLHEAKFQQRETGSTVCWDGFNLVRNLRIIQHGFIDTELLKVMTSALEGWRSSLLNNSWNETKFRFEQFGFFTLGKKKQF